MKVNSTEQGKMLLYEGLDSIGEKTFYCLNQITEIEIPKSVTTIKAGAFQGCNALEKIALPFVGRTRSTINYQTESDYSWSGGSYYLFGYIFGGYYERYNSSTLMPSNGENLVYQGEARDTYSSYYYYNVYYIPSTLREVNITDATGISAYAFYGCTMLTKMSINDGITIIGQYAFYNCVNLLQINGEADGSYNIPNGVKTIGTFAFYNCVNIEEISLDATVMSIGENSFENCAGITLLKYGGMTEDNWNAISIGAGNDFLTSASRTYYKGTMKLTLNLNGFSWATSGYTIAVVFNGSNGNQWIEMVLVDGIYVCDIPDGYEDSEFCFVRVQGTVLSDEYIKHQTNTFSTVMNTNYKLTSWSTAEKY